MRSAVVTLPQGVAADPKNVANTCERADFEASRCPANSRVGSAEARVTITPEVIPGDVYLVRVPGLVLPGLGLSFTGRFAQRVLSTVKINGESRLVTRFDAVPDLPLKQLTIHVDSGPHSPLQLPALACANGTRWDGTFTGQGGQTSTAQTGLQCAAVSQVRLSDAGGLSLRLFDFGGRHLTSLKATLPAGWRFDPEAAKKPNAYWVRMTGSAAKATFTRQSLTVRATTGLATTVRLKVDGKVVGVKSRAAKRAKKVTLAVRLSFSDGTVQTQSRTVKAR
jgi:hypothetical protein